MLPPPLWPLRTILFLPPTGALLSADKERVSDGLLLQLLGKVGRRRHKGKSYRKKHAVGTQKTIQSEGVLHSRSTPLLYS